jgi:hypothetical protein
VSADDDAAIAHGLVAVAQSAREGFTPVDRQRYDGEVRAAELRAVLERVAAAGVRR